MYITHDLSTVRYFSERIFVMYAGKLVERVKSPICCAILSTLIPVLYWLPLGPGCQKCRHLQGSSTRRASQPGQTSPGCRFHPRCPRIIQGLCEEKNRRV